MTIMRNIDLQLLRTFRAVTTTGNMTHASALLNITQGAVSQQINKLEAQLRCKLLLRGKSGLTLTAEGEKLFARSQALLSLNDEIWRDMTEPQFKGQISLGIPLDLVTTQLPGTLRLFADDFPDVDINLVCAPTLDLKRQFEEGLLDLTLLQELPGELTATPLFSDQLVWITAKAGKARNLDPLPLSISSTDCVFRLPTTLALDQIGRRWKRVYESNNIDATQAMIRMDMAVGVYLKSLVPVGLDWFKEAENFPILPEYSVTLAVANGTEQELANHLANYIHRSFNLKKAA